METKNYVVICNKINSITLKSMKPLEVNNFSITVDTLIDQIAQSLDVDKNCFGVVCFGKLLDHSKTLEFYGIENGTILYLLKNKSAQPSGSRAAVDSEPPSYLSTEQQGMMISLKSALLTPPFRNVLENLSDFDNRENLITVNPQLRNDPSLFGVLSDSDLLHAYISKDNIRKVLKRFPNFLEVATYVSASFHEEINSTNANHSNMGYQGSMMNYSIDAISEDEDDPPMDDDEETSSISSINTNNSGRRLSDSQIFSNMLMQAYNLQRQRHRTNRLIITADMLRQALQSTSSNSSSNVDIPQACETVPNVPNVETNQESSGLIPSSSSDCIPPPPASPAPSTTNEPRTTAQILIGYAPQLRQMRELGINDDIVAIQALEATNGDLQAAINIIFSDNQ